MASYDDDDDDDDGGDFFLMRTTLSVGHVALGGSDNPARTQWVGPPSTCAQRRACCERERSIVMLGYWVGTLWEEGRRQRR